MANIVKSTNLQNLPSANISSNNHYYYKDETKYEDKHKIFIDDGREKNVYLNPNKPIYHVQNYSSKKHVYNKQENSAFEKAIVESEKIKNYHEYKFHKTENKRELIKEIVFERNKNIKEKLDAEKRSLQETLIRIIKDSLKFTKKNNPIISMIPNKISNAINEIKEKRKTKNLDSNNNNNNNNSSLGISFNLSQLSSNSTGHKKYDSSAFLKALGLDLDNLSSDNIKINIDEAYDYIKKWKINRSDVNEIIRMKVVNEIMNVEERRSVKKIKKLNEKYENYIEYKKQKEINDINKQIEERYNYEENYSEKKGDNEKELNNLENNNNKNLIKLPNDKSHLNSNSNLPNNEKNIIHLGKITNNRPNSNINIVNVYNKISDTSKSKEKNSKNNDSDSPNKKKYDVRLNLKIESPLAKKKRKLVLNSYKSVDRIINIINKSEKLKSNENLCKHFRHIKYNKKIDDLTIKLLDQNKIFIETFEEVEFE
jgi:hypothetical protein